MVETPPTELTNFITNMGKMNHRILTKICENKFVQSTELPETIDIERMFNLQGMVKSIDSVDHKMTQSIRNQHQHQHNQRGNVRQVLQTTDHESNKINKKEYKACMETAKGPSNTSLMHTQGASMSLILSFMHYISPITILECGRMTSTDRHHTHTHTHTPNGTTSRGLREFSFEMKKCLDMYPNLLKSLSSRHKSLRRRIEQYLDADPASKDLSYMDDEYMSFWSSLLNRPVLVVSWYNRLYRCYHPTEFSAPLGANVVADTTETVENTSNMSNNSMCHALVIKVRHCRDRDRILYDFEDHNGMDNDKTNFIEQYKQSSGLKTWYDMRQLKTMKISEIQEICKEHGISTMNGTQRCRKDFLIQELGEKLILI
jgi:hypothetical protein